MCSSVLMWADGYKRNTFLSMIELGSGSEIWRTGNSVMLSLSSLMSLPGGAGSDVSRHPS